MKRGGRRRAAQALHKSAPRAALLLEGLVRSLDRKP